jgi:predicted RNase H-like HicB family nuclease
LNGKREKQKTQRRIMKTIIQVHKDGKFYVATDLNTNVADQGATEKEAVRNLKKGLEEHYRILMELTPKDRKLSLIDIEVEKYVKASRPIS